MNSTQEMPPHCGAQKRSAICLPAKEFHQPNFCTAYLSLLLGLIMASLPQHAFAQGKDMGVSPVWMWRNQGGSAQPSVPRFEEQQAIQQAAIARQQAQRAQQALQQRLNEAHASNERGVAFANKGDWAKAVPILQEAAKKNPSNKTIRSNLAHALAELRTLQQDQAAAANMQQTINHFVQTLDAPPASSGGLDFDGRINSDSPSGGGGLDFISPDSTSAAKPVTSLEFGDPMVVDARNVSSGLPLPVDTAIAGVFATAPPGISDRVRKGFQAAETEDWKVAQAWFEDALNRDPENVALKNLVVAARSNLSAAPASPASPHTAAQGAQLPTDNDTRFLFDPRSRAQVINDEVFIEGMDPGMKKFNADERAASLKAAQARGDAEQIRLLQDMYRTYDLEKSRVGRVAAPLKTPEEAAASTAYGDALRKLGLTIPADVTRPVTVPAVTDDRPQPPTLQLLLDALKNPPKSKHPSVSAVRG